MVRRTHTHTHTTHHTPHTTHTPHHTPHTPHTTHTHTQHWALLWKMNCTCSEKWDSFLKSNMFYSCENKSWIIKVKVMNIWKGPDPSSFTRPFCVLRAQLNSSLNAFSDYITLFCWASVYVKHCKSPNKTRERPERVCTPRVFKDLDMWEYLMKTNPYVPKSCFLS